MLLIVLCLLLSLTLTEARSNGVSDVACRNLTPIHSGIEPQVSIPRVQVLPHSYRVYRNQQIKIQLRSVSSNFTFRGFLIQAKSVQNDEIVGHFVVSNNVKVMVCGNSYSTASHSNPSAKSVEVLLWKAPSNFIGFVRFHATVVESFDMFWTNLVSAQLRIL